MQNDEQRLVAWLVIGLKTVTNKGKLSIIEQVEAETCVATKISIQIEKQVDQRVSRSF